MAALRSQRWPQRHAAFIGLQESAYHLTQLFEAGSAIQLAAELFQTMTSTKMNGVAYRGSPLALNDVMAGHVAMMFADVGPVSGQFREGKIRADG